MVSAAQDLASVEAQLTAVLGFLCGDILFGLEPEGALHLSGRTHDGFVESAFHVRPQQFAPPLVPSALVNTLADGRACLHVGLAVRSSHEALAPAVRLGAVSATWILEPVRGRSVVPAKPLCAARAAVAGFPFPVALELIGGVPEGGLFSYTALWRLETPLPCRARHQQAAALAMVRQVAAHLGAQAPAPDTPLEALAVPVPGAPIRSLAPCRVTCLAFDTAAAVTPEQLTTAIGGKEES